MEDRYEIIKDVLKDTECEIRFVNYNYSKSALILRPRGEIYGYFTESSGVVISCCLCSCIEVNCHKIDCRNGFCISNNISLFILAFIIHWRYD